MMHATAPRLLQATTSRSASTAGRLLFDRDYHIHLGGAIPPSLIETWVRDEKLTLDDEISDLVAATSACDNVSSSSYHSPMIKVRRAFEDYRGFAICKQSQQQIMNKVDVYTSAYNTRQYDSLPVFLTLYRAFSKRHLLYTHAHEICRGPFVHPCADVRVSIPHPNSREDNNLKSEESTSQFAQRAMEEMMYFQSCLLPTQNLFINFRRQTFNVKRNLEYFNAFVTLLSDEVAAAAADGESKHVLFKHRLAFDFAGQPLPIMQTLPLVDKLRNAFPSSFICYHHGEVCPGIKFSDRVKHTFDLIPYVDRIGHGLCLGLAVLGINPDFDDSTDVKNRVMNKEAALQENKALAYQCLQQLAEQKIGIEISPTCNISLGGAMSKQILIEYVREFLKMGVDVFVGTDDPGFLNTTMGKEIVILQSAGLCS
jgi:hypothetical protein